MRPIGRHYGWAVVGPDPIFANPRLAAIYDVFDGDRDDLDLYETIVAECGARTVIDVGCGTGELATRLARRGLSVTAVDPALASLDVARTKPGADRVTWLHGTARDLPDLAADLVTMTANVAQVFVEERDWLDNLRQIRRVLATDGLLVFEARDPSRRAWERWIPALTTRRLELEGEGAVEGWTELVAVDLPLVHFRHHYRFEVDGEVLVSDSQLCFRSRTAIEQSLVDVGFDVVELRDAPDRPGLEFVFVCRRN